MRKSRGNRLLGRILARELTEAELIRASGSLTADSYRGISICGIDYTPTRDKYGNEID
ncbi:MAG TPA: hypothetical protein VLX28_14640 [Thermoanaerobaculia bacterium]|nr:hypothetical protein [Thermoanaerobaculia bacterium]